MTVEAQITPQDADVANPAAGDDLSEGDDHVRGIKVMLKKLALEHVGTITAAAAASVNTYSSIGTFVAGYDYILVGEGVYGSAVAALYAQVSTGGGSAAGANYLGSYNGVTNATNSAGSGATAQVRLSGGNSVGNASAEATRFELTILNPMGTANPRHLHYTAGGVLDAGATTYSLHGDAVYNTATAVDGLVITVNGANITGVFKLYRRYRPV